MGKRIAILGAAESGTGAAILAAQKGYDVYVSDLHPIKEKYREMLNRFDLKWEEGKHSEPEILSACEVVKSPGIPDHAPLVMKLREAGIPVISEIEFAGRYTNAKKICITGSNGKTTTTLLTGHILRKAGLDAVVAGNVGNSFAWQVASKDHEIYVLELSSFQLDGMFDFRADISVILNITPDHLDRYEGSFESYTRSKMRIMQNQRATDHCIYCLDDLTIKYAMKKNKQGPTTIPFTIREKPGHGAWLENDQTIRFHVNEEEFELDTSDLPFPGKHNIYNGMASVIAARLLDLRKETIRECLEGFENAEHRLEPVCFVRGVEFINDSKATNVNAAWFALESMSKPVVWVMGGLDKGNDYTDIKPLAEKKVKAIVCLGKDNSRIKKEFAESGIPIVETYNANDAVKASFHFAMPGDVVLLSPACASFDLFENYEDRGKQFKFAVHDL